jgi:hypothetical protein
LDCLDSLSPTFYLAIVLSGIIVLVIASSCLVSAPAISQTPAVFPLNSKPYGMTYSDWAAKQWQWIISTPSSKSPLTDNNGTRCAEGQQGPVWFLVGTSGGKQARSCTIPSGKALFLNIFTGECSTKENRNLKTGPELLKCAINSNKGASVSASVDGVNIPNIETYRVQSPSISVVYPQAGESIFPIAEGGPAISAADGWYVMLKPLSRGTHTLHFDGSSPPSDLNSDGYVTDVTYHLTIK